MAQATVSSPQAVNFWGFNPALWPWGHELNLFAWHSGSWWCTIIPSSVAYSLVVWKVSSGQRCDPQTTWFLYTPPPYGITRHTLHIHCTHTHVCARSIWFSHTHWIFLLFPLVAAKKWTSIWIYVEMSYDFWGVRTCQIHFFNPIHYVLSVSPLGPGCNIVLHILFLCCTNLELSLVRA